MGRKAISIVLQHGDEVFITRRKETMRAFPGYWAFPGGKIDKGDGSKADIKLGDLELSTSQALIREAQEELGIDLWEVDSEVRLIGKISPPNFNPISWDTFFIHVLLKDKPQIDLCSGEFEWGEWMKAQQFVTYYEKGEALCVPPVLKICRDIANNIRPSLLQELVETKESEVPSIESLNGVLQLMPLSNTVPPADRTNCFIVGDDKKLIIDPAPKDQEEWEKFLNTVAGLDVSAVMLTHHHGDHRAKVVETAQYFKVPILLSEYTRDIIWRKHGSDFFQNCELKLLKEGDIVGEWLGHPLKVYQVPGHDEGQVAIAPDNMAWFLASDLFQGIGTVVIGPDEGDMQKYFKTLEKVIKLDPKVLYPSHGIGLGGTEILKRTLKHREFREEQILEMYQKGQSLDRMVESIYFDLPKKILPYAKANIESHLIKLKKEGKVV